MNIDESKIIENVDEQMALACLLADGTCFINTVDISSDYNISDDKKIFTTAVYVLVSDIFAWGCADAEPIECNDGETPNAIIDLYKLKKEKGFWGLVHWVCLRRKEQPQFPIKRDMIKAGHWVDELESLTPNSYDSLLMKNP
jgi:hypothetical protein